MQRPDLIIFEQGEKAKAAEVNQNFEELGDYIQGSISEVNTTVTNAINTLQTLANAAAPTGTVQAYCGMNTPSGWLICNGAAVSRTQYSSLFSVIGTTFGGGDGTTTFNLPNLIDKFIEGSDTVGTEKEAGLPQHTHIINYRNSSGTGLIAGGNPAPLLTGNRTLEVLSGEADDDNGIYGNSDTVQPPAVTMKYIIRT